LTTTIPQKRIARRKRSGPWKLSTDSWSNYINWS